MNRLRSWAKVVLRELPDGFNSVGGIRRSGIIVPDLIIRTLIKENKIRQQPRRLSCTECSSITRINSPLGHYPQTTVFFELLKDECCRLGLSELHCTLMQLSATLVEASERERFALVCFHALLGGDIDSILKQSIATLSEFISNYLTKHPVLQYPVEEYLFFAFYSIWLNSCAE